MDGPKGPLNLRMTKVTDVSALTNCYELNLSHTNVTDVSTLKNYHTVYGRV